MSVVILIARLVFAGVFAVAGVAKLADRPGSRRAALVLALVKNGRV